MRQKTGAPPPLPPRDADDDFESFSYNGSTHGFTNGSSSRAAAHNIHMMAPLNNGREARGGGGGGSLKNNGHHHYHHHHHDDVSTKETTIMTTTTTHTTKRRDLLMITMGMLGILLLFLVVGAFHQTGIVGDMQQQSRQVVTTTPKNSVIGAMTDTDGKNVPSTTTSGGYYTSVTTTTTPYPYCDRNSKLPECCTPDHCQLVVKSTMYSECCKNLVAPKRRRRKLQQLSPKPASAASPTKPQEGKGPQNLGGRQPPENLNSRLIGELLGGLMGARPANPRERGPAAATSRTQHKPPNFKGRPGGAKPRPPPVPAKRRPPPTKKFPILITATPRSGTVFTKTLLTKLGAPVADDVHTPVGATMQGMVSWMHIFQDRGYFGPAVLGQSKFHAVWHQVRDPLKSLTSLAFTEPLAERVGGPQYSTQYIQFLKKHIIVTPNLDIYNKHLPMPKSQQHYMVNSTQVTEEFLIWRGLEFYLQWNRFISQLKIPRFQLEDLVQHKNMDLLDDIFASMGKPKPNHALAIRIINQDENDKKRRRLLRQQRQSQQRRRRLHTNQRKHRSTLAWDELCRVSPTKTKQFLEMSHQFGYYLNKTIACGGDDEPEPEQLSLEEEEATVSPTILVATNNTTTTSRVAGPATNTTTSSSVLAATNTTSSSAAATNTSTSSVVTTTNTTSSSVAPTNTTATNKVAPTNTTTSTTVGASNTTTSSVVATNTTSR